jgi:hypothetical protein
MQRGRPVRLAWRRSIAFFPLPVRLTRHPSPSHQDSGSPPAQVRLAFHSSAVHGRPLFSWSRQGGDPRKEADWVSGATNGWGRSLADVQERRAVTPVAGR